MISYLLFSFPMIIRMALLCTCSSMNSGLLNTNNPNNPLKSQQNFTWCLAYIFTYCSWKYMAFYMYECIYLFNNYIRHVALPFLLFIADKF